MQSRSRIPIIDTVQATITISKAGQGYNPNRADIIIPAGSTTDETYINSVITTLSTTGGGRIKLLEGTYTITNTITMASNVELEGSGQYNTVIQIVNGINATFYMITADGLSGIKIRHLTLHGNQDNRVGGNQYGILFDNSATQNLVEYVFFYKLHSTEIAIQNTCSYIKINKCVFNCNPASLGISIVILTNCIYIHVTNCVLLSNRPSSITITSSNYNIISQCIYIGTTYPMNCTGTASYNSFINNLCLNCAGITFSANCSNNTIKGNIQNTITTSHAIVVNTGSNNNLIENNYILNAVNGVSLSGDNNIISNNYIYTCTGFGFNITGGTDNQVNSNSVISSTGYGIYFSAVSRSSASLNNIKNSGYDGIRITGSSNNNIIGNLIIDSSQGANNTYSGIYVLSNSDYNNIQINKCSHTGGAAQPQYGINIAAATCDGNLVTNNDLYTSGATGSLNDVGTGTVTAAGNRL